MRDKKGRKGKNSSTRTPCLDEVWSLTRDVVTQTLQKVVPEGKKRWPEWMMEAREWRKCVLEKGRDLRGQEGGEFEKVQMLLKEVSSLLKEAREKVNEQRTAELEAEMSEAWRNRQFALLHALGVEYARHGKGPKKRYYFSPRTVWDREDWIREMSKPASEGGMRCMELTARYLKAQPRWSRTERTDLRTALLRHKKTKWD